MIVPWQQMTVEEFAGFERILGERIIVVNNTHWAQVRPLFFRPLLPFQEFQPGLAKPPVTALFGGFQHAVPSGAEANSCLNLLMFEDAGSYSLDSLDYNRKRQVKQAAKQFIIRSVADGQEFKQNAYGQRTTINKLAKTICRLTGSRSEIKYAAERPDDVKHSLASIEKLRAAGFAPTGTFADGLAATIARFRRG
jgi:hypothetical protein